MFKKNNKVNKSKEVLYLYCLSGSLISVLSYLLILSMVFFASKTYIQINIRTQLRSNSCMGVNVKEDAHSHS